VKSVYEVHYCDRREETRNGEGVLRREYDIFDRLFRLYGADDAYFTEQK